MKLLLISFAALGLAGVSLHAVAKNPGENARHAMMTHTQMHAALDRRIFLASTPERKQHQLSNMRSHLQAVQTIAGLLSEGKFDEASGIAHAKLGLTPEMKMMCNQFDNAEFKQLGLAFHESADALGDTLKTGDMRGSLRALHTTMSYCVQCHETFRQ